MRNLALTLLLIWPALAGAKVLNVEFKFTPYTGDAKKDDQVQSVAGTARVLINNVPYAEQPVRKDTLPVMFDEREIAAAVWVPTESMGPALRKGKNTIKLEFEPEDAKAPYRAQFRWASVTDQVTEREHEGGKHSTNQADEGVDDKEAKGTVVFEREFVADFAKDMPWHHFPAVASLGDDDRQKLGALVKERTELFKPDFAALYETLDGQERVKVAEVKKAKCLDAAYEAGVRFPAPPPDALEFVTTGGPEVVVRRKGAPLFAPDPAPFDKIEGDEMQMCAGMTLMSVYPQRLVVVRGQGGAWEVVY